ncbi:MAG: hypothetical protein WBL93_05290 [Lutisporaceae bacterium]
MALTKSLNVVVELAGSEQTRAAAYKKTLQYVISKCMCEVDKDGGNNLSESVNRGTSREGLLNTRTEGRMY